MVPHYFSISGHLIIVMVVLHMAYFVFLECTAFVTVLLTIVRSLALYFPFYQPKSRNIAVSFAAFFLYAAVKGGCALHYKTEYQIKGLESWESFVMVYNIMLLTSLLLTITVVLTVNLMTIRKLLTSGNEMAACAVQPPSAQINRHATITILILSALFCFFNLLYSVVLCNLILGKETISYLFRFIVVFTAVPMNSAVNPFVYFCRKREMRRFLCRNICCPSSTDHRETSPDIGMSFSNCVAISPNYNTNQLDCPPIETCNGDQSTRSDFVQEEEL